MKKNCSKKRCSDTKAYHSASENRLNENIKLEFQEKAQEIRFSDDPKPCDLVNAAKELIPILERDEEFVKRAMDIKNKKSPFLICKNLPYDIGTIEPPKNGKRPDTKLTWISELMSLSLIILSGYCPFSFFEEKLLELIHQIAPALGKEATRGNGGKVPLDWHTDDSILPKEFQPKVLLLMGLINEGKNATFISLIDEAIKSMDAGDIELLMSPNYRLYTPDSFDDALFGRRLGSAWRPILEVDNGVIWAGGSLFAAQPRNVESEKALASLKKSLFHYEIPVIVERGTALIFDNTRCFHRRGNLDFHKRWLQRCFGTDNIDGFRNFFGVDGDAYIFHAIELLLRELIKQDRI